jgi:hypothetical protein
MSCTLLTQKAVQKCTWKALKDEYKLDVTNDTSLRDRSGLALDDEEIRTNTYEVVRDAVIAKGCALTAFGPDQMVDCATVGDIVKAVTDDILSN